MTDLLTPAHPPADPRERRPERSGSGWFRAVWRWHFFASFIVVPVLLLLAVTGLIYLFRFQIEPLMHPDLMRVDPPGGAVAQPYVQQLAVVESAYPGSTAVSLTEPKDAGSPTVVSITTADGASRDVYVSPYGPEVLGSLDPDTTLSGTAIRLHADLMTGSRWGGYVIELGACWAIVMALTGYYLFARGFKARRRARRAGRTGARLRWRHGLVGAVAGVGLLALLVSGLPWTDFWGAKVQTLATERGTSMWSLDHGAVSSPTSTLDESLPHSHAKDIPWAQQESEVPESTPPGDGERSVANVDTAITVADGTGLRHPMTVALPAAGDEGGVYSVIGYAFDAPSDEQTVHVDRYGGQVVSTYGFDDYPALAKVVSQGIGLHEGRSLGIWSFWGSALMCLATVFMCLSGPLMWWRRRPRGGATIGAPRGRMPVTGTPLLAVGLVALGVFLPFFGLSLLVVLVLDQLVLRRVPGLGRWFATT
ncbi:PepSY domain-containing protein [Nocardioides sp. MAH-18]|uniref:PepSY domain-containing protein n=1 Tax=Nocardioides agri TaxID=2682843 RepID=A0A6L6XTF0_9ACTN|nr:MULTISPECIES: PepSY domain-containing protein [unclassified Nocardioides]MBA2955822.1 PepSY domain-containing protein [Nocardioides sp. CGMCC 1.13656]MVQ50671.1 PepSY domain-containing protein [Nocardioides sp. MAH-18]